MCRAPARWSRWSRTSPGYRIRSPLPCGRSSSIRGCSGKMRRYLFDDRNLGTVHGDGDRRDEDEPEDDLLSEDADLSPYAPVEPHPFTPRLLEAPNSSTILITGRLTST